MYPSGTYGLVTIGPNAGTQGVYPNTLNVRDYFLPSDSYSLKIDKIIMEGNNHVTEFHSVASLPETDTVTIRGSDQLEVVRLGVTESLHLENLTNLLDIRLEIFNPVDMDSMQLKNLPKLRLIRMEYVRKLNDFTWEVSFK